MDPNTRQAKRAPVTLKIKFKSVTIDQFIERYAADVSPGGIFIRTKEPLAVGTQMRFEFQLRDATPLITGDGTVVWTRENDPTRPNAAPGMGVRFDRLGEGSQPILDRILAEKAKQPAPASGTTEPPPNKSFMDAPTRVAPSPLVGALAGEPKAKMGQMAPSKSGFADERTDTTPLPRPMPFHSDADEFPEETFEEATKVRALDELVAATAAHVEAEPVPAAAPAARTSDRAIAAPAARTSDRAIAAPAARTSDRAIAAPPTAATAPADRTAPVVALAEPIVDEPEPAIRAVPVPSDAPARVTEEPAAKPVAARAAAAAAVTAESKPAVAAEPTAVPGTSSRGTSAVVIGLLLAAIVAAAVWFFVLRKRHEPKADGGGTGSVAAVVVDAATAAPAIDAGEPPPVDAPAAPVVTAPLVVKASVAGATVEVVETGASGPAPFTVELEVGKPFTLRVKAPGFLAAEVQATGGDKTASAKLEPMPRFVRVTTTPPGVEIGVDGTNSGQVSPADVALTKAQAAKGSVRIYLRKRGFASTTVTVKASEFSEDGDKLVATVTSDLAPVKTTTGGGGSATPTGGSGSGSDVGGGSGSDAGGGAGSGSATPTAGSGSGSGSAAGSGSGSAAGSGSGSAAGSGSGSAAGSGSGSAKPATGSGSGSSTTTTTTGSGTGSSKPSTGTGSGSGTSTGPTPDWTNP